MVFLLLVRGCIRAPLLLSLGLCRGAYPLFFFRGAKSVLIFELSTS